MKNKNSFQIFVFVLLSAVTILTTTTSCLTETRALNYTVPLDLAQNEKIEFVMATDSTSIIYPLKEKVSLYTDCKVADEPTLSDASTAQIVKFEERWNCRCATEESFYVYPAITIDEVEVFVLSTKTMLTTQSISNGILQGTGNVEQFASKQETSKAWTSKPDKQVFLSKFLILRGALK